MARHHGHRHEPLPVRARRDARHQDHRVRLPRHRHALPPLRHRSRARHPRRRPERSTRHHPRRPAPDRRRGLGRDDARWVHGGRGPGRGGRHAASDGVEGHGEGS